MILHVEAEQITGVEGKSTYSAAKGQCNGRFCRVLQVRKSSWCMITADMVREGFACAKGFSTIVAGVRENQCMLHSHMFLEVS